MKTKKCPKCGFENDISNFKCENCKYKLRKNKNIVINYRNNQIGIFVLIAIFTILALMILFPMFISGTTLLIVLLVLTLLLFAILYIASILQKEYKCPKCGHKNKEDSLNCEACGYKIAYTETEEQAYKETKDTLNNIKGKTLSTVLNLFRIPKFLMGFLFIFISCFVIINNYDKSKNYLSTTGTFVDYVDCTSYDDGNESCKGLYEYVVNGKTYNGTNDIGNDKTSLKKTIEVKYNPNNPSEYIINDNWELILAWGVIYVVVGILILVIITKLSNKIITFIKNKIKQ